MDYENDGRYDQGVVHASPVEDDPSKMLLTVEGGDWQLKEIADAFHFLTVLPKAIKGTNTATIPKTWAVITQLARLGLSKGFLWRPDEALNEWVTQEFIRRYTEFGDFSDLKFDVGSLDRVPMPHQAAGAFIGAMNKRFFFADDMGPQPVSTPILTRAGWKTLGTTMPGDEVIAQDGSWAKVLERKDFGVQPVYKVTMSDRTSTRANGSHLWRVFTANHRQRGHEGYVLKTDEIIKLGLRDKAGNRKFFLPQQPYMKGTADWTLPIPPYLYGALLGDGTIQERSTRFTSADYDIMTRVTEEARLIGTSSCITRDPSAASTASFRRSGALFQALKDLDAVHHAEGKYVHETYLQADAPTRMEVLRGLLDTDGSVASAGHAGIEFTSVSEQLAEDVAFLARSLAGTATVSGPLSSYLNGVRKQDKYRVAIRMQAASRPFFCERKANAWQEQAGRIQRQNPPRAIDSIVPDGEEAVCCIRIDHESHVYLTDTTLIPTHNTGKTGTALLTLAEMDARGMDPFPAYIVCPAGVVDPTLEEIEEWGFSFTSTAYRGARRKQLSSRYQIYVMSWHVFRLDMQHPKKPVLDIDGNPLKDDKGRTVTEEDKNALPELIKFNRPHTIVMDEAHALCNVKTKQSVSARKAARVCDYAFPMSGTPITKDVSGFWSALNVLDIQSFPSQDRYKDLYCDSYQKSIYEEKVTGLSDSNKEEFYLLLQGSMRRVAKADVLKDLPPKRYSPRMVEIPPAYMAAYREMEEDMIAHIPDSPDPMEVMSTLAQLTRLMQLACSACDVTTEQTDEIDDETGLPKIITHVTPREPSWKIDELMTVLEDNQGNPVVAFGTHASLMRLAGARAEKAGLKVGYIIGGQSAATRTRNRKAFQNGELDLICVTTQAGGVGLTLTASDTAVFLERPWGFWQSSQSEDRIHRRGQTRECNIIDIVAENTIDSKIRAAIKEKAGSLSELVRDPRIIREVLGGK